MIIQELINTLSPRPSWVSCSFYSHFASLACNLTPWRNAAAAAADDDIMALVKSTVGSKVERHVNHFQLSSIGQ